MSTRRRTPLALLVVLVTAGCVCVSPDQAVNISEVHDGIGRLMPYAVKGIKAEIATQNAIATNTSRTQTERDAASSTVTELTGRLIEAKLLPTVSEPIRDWAIAKVGTDTFTKAKKDRDAKIGAGG